MYNSHFKFDCCLLPFRLCCVALPNDKTLSEPAKRMKKRINICNSKFSPIYYTHSTQLLSPVDDLHKSPVTNNNSERNIFPISGERLIISSVQQVVRWSAIANDLDPAQSARKTLSSRPHYRNQFVISVSDLNERHSHSPRGESDNSC